MFPGFVWKQFVICTNPYSAPLWITGLLCFLRSPRYRPLAWMYLIPLAFFYVAQGVFYYLAPAYPMLIAMGAAAGEHWAGRLSRPWPRVVGAVLFTGIAGAGVYGCALVLPLASRGPLMHFALQNNDALREEFGWNELVQTVAGIRDSLPVQKRPNVGVVVGNYGEQGAIEILGSAYRLPTPISMTNSAWLRGYPLPPPSTLIVLGFSRESAERAFTSCSPDTTAIPMVSKTRRASITLTYSCVVARASHGPSSGRSTKPLVKAILITPDAETGRLVFE